MDLCLSKLGLNKVLCILPFIKIIILGIASVKAVSGNDSYSYRHVMCFDVCDVIDNVMLCDVIDMKCSNTLHASIIYIYIYIYCIDHITFIS